jgi:hypothetical protein
MYTPSATAVTMVGMQLLNTRHVSKSRSAVYSAQRHQGGSGPRPQRGTAAELSTPPTCSRTRQKDKQRCIGIDRGLLKASARNTTALNIRPCLQQHNALTHGGPFNVLVYRVKHALYRRAHSGQA